MRQGKLKDVSVIGFAIFAMFFGAGNLIFPPFLGMRSGSNWFLSFLFFIVMDIGISVLTLLVITKMGRGAAGITEKLGKVPSALILGLNVLCLGPLIAIPRTAATAYEFAVQPFFPAVSSKIFSILFFAVVVLFCFKKSNVIDIIGTFFAPLILAALTFLIVKGVTTPLGAIEISTSVGSAVQEGISAGYQTMDVMAAIIFSSVILLAVIQKGYHSEKAQFKMVLASGLLASAILFFVYGGLAYLGATVSGMYPPDVDRVALLIGIVRALLGEKGIVLLGILVCTACLSPAIGLLSSASAFFEIQTRGKVKYGTWVLGFAGISCVISNFGIEKILRLAAPILDVLYPVLLLLIFANLFRSKISSVYVYRYAACMTAGISILSVVEQNLGSRIGMAALPLYSVGFQWVLPALLCGMLGTYMPREKMVFKLSIPLVYR